MGRKKYIRKAKKAGKKAKKAKKAGRKARKKARKKTGKAASKDNKKKEKETTPSRLMILQYNFPFFPRGIKKEYTNYGHRLKKFVKIIKAMDPRPDPSSTPPNRLSR